MHGHHHLPLLYILQYKEAVHIDHCHDGHYKPDCLEYDKHCIQLTPFSYLPDCNRKPSVKDV